MLVGTLWSRKKSKPLIPLDCYNVITATQGDSPHQMHATNKHMQQLSYDGALLLPYTSLCSALLVALYFTPVSWSVGRWAEFRTSVASRLASLLNHNFLRNKFRTFCVNEVRAFCKVGNSTPSDKGALLSNWCYLPASFCHHHHSLEEQFQPCQPIKAPPALENKKLGRNFAGSILYEENKANW